jgi:3-isopropylmalate dehydrogenase
VGPHLRRGRAEFPDIATDYQHVDAAAMFLVTQPQRYDVIVTDNLFGDILTDIAPPSPAASGWPPAGASTRSGASRRCSNRSTARPPTSRAKAVATRPAAVPLGRDHA